LKNIFTILHNALFDNPAKRVSIRRRVINLSLPVLLSALFQRLVSIIDIFMVGGLGAAAIAAVGLGQFLIFVAMTVFWGLSTGTALL
jgi:Na+-driven multidrug efflux pump